MTAQVLEFTLDTYEAALKEPRTQISHVFASYFSEKNPRTLLSFWLNFSSQGIGMTEPVEDWIKRAGRNCESLGYTELGKQLGKHAIHEANHHLMMIHDTKCLVEQWNKLYSPKLDAEVLMKQFSSDAVTNYRQLHEYYIEGQTPYCQIAIEYEIENLSAMYGLKMINHAVAILGKDFKESLSFIDEHAAIDVAHTDFNRKVISNFIDSYPETTNQLVNAGTKALKSYSDFITTCLTKSKDL